MVSLPSGKRINTAERLGNADPYTAMQEGGDPLMNSSWVYVTRINKIMDRFHECMVHRDYGQAFNCLRSLDSELKPRFLRKRTLVDRFKIKLDSCEVACRQNYSLSVTSRRGVKYGSSIEFANALWDWFTTLNMLAHELNLIMIDKMDESEAYKIE